MFRAYDIALEIIRQLAVVVPQIKRHNADLAKQIVRAGNSITLNLAEGSRRRGEDRSYLYSVAAGSADEVLAGLDTAHAWGWIGRTPVLRDRIDHLLAILWKIVPLVRQSPRERAEMIEDLPSLDRPIDVAP